MSVLGDIKNVLSIEPSVSAFDRELLFNINGVFVTLYNLGIGVEKNEVLTPFNAEMYSDWSDLNCKSELPIVKNYVAFKVKQMFDPPASSAASTSINECIKEYEWRIKTIHEREVTKT